LPPLPGLPAGRQARWPEGNENGSKGEMCYSWNKISNNYCMRKPEKEFISAKFSIFNNRHYALPLQFCNVRFDSTSGRSPSFIARLTCVSRVCTLACAIVMVMNQTRAQVKQVMKIGEEEDSSKDILGVNGDRDVRMDNNELSTHVNQKLNDIKFINNISKNNVSKVVDKKKLKNYKKIKKKHLN
jgi:hypothetical protein